MGSGYCPVGIRRPPAGGARRDRRGRARDGEPGAREQRNATGIVNSVTTEQIERSPDSDAAQAVQRVSGVTVQDGKYVFVRGLGERYTTASLNGARLPSPEPERKVVPLDLFPSACWRASRPRRRSRRISRETSAARRSI